MQGPPGEGGHCAHGLPFQGGLAERTFHSEMTHLSFSISVQCFVSVHERHRKRNKRTKPREGQEDF